MDGKRASARQILSEKSILKEQRMIAGACSDSSCNLPCSFPSPSPANLVMLQSSPEAGWEASTRSFNRIRCFSSGCGHLL